MTPVRFGWLAAGLLFALGARPTAHAAPVACAGITEPVLDVSLSLPVAGVVTARPFKEGQFVRKGDAILEIDHRMQDLEVDRRRLIMENLKADWESTKTVFEKGMSVSRDDLLKKESDYRVAAADYQLALEELAQRKLLAPASGYLTEIDVRVGEACPALQPVVRLVDPRRCYFIANVDAGQTGRLAVGRAVQLELQDAGATVRVPGTIEFVSPVVDSASGLQKVRAVFDNADGRIRPGVSGRMIID
jgi:RND family efflux transporter MFP subunit